MMKKSTNIQVETWKKQKEMGLQFDFEIVNIHYVDVIL